MTYVHAEIDGDTFFPPLSPDDWYEHERREIGVGPKNAHPLSFVTVFRRGGRPAAGSAYARLLAAPRPVHPARSPVFGPPCFLNVMGMWSAIVSPDAGTIGVLPHACLVVLDSGAPSATLSP